MKLLLGARARDREELDFLSARLAAGGTFVDIGANIGFYSLILTARGAARTLAIEPVPTVYERLLFNILANSFEDRVVTVPVALGDEPRTAVITAAPDLGSSSIVRSDIAGPKHTVKMVPLSHVLQQHGFTSVDAMKIDVEGMEDSVLWPFFETAPRSLWPTAVVIEDIHQSEWKRDILASMLHLGYKKMGRTRSNVFLSLCVERLEGTVGSSLAHP